MIGTGDGCIEQGHYIFLNCEEYSPEVGLHWPCRVLQIREHRVYGIYLMVAYALPRSYLPPPQKQRLKDNELAMSNEIMITPLSCVAAVLGRKSLAHGGKSYFISKRLLSFHRKGDRTVYGLLPDCVLEDEEASSQATPDKEKEVEHERPGPSFDDHAESSHQRAGGTEDTLPSPISMQDNDLSEWNSVASSASRSSPLDYTPLEASSKNTTEQSTEEAPPFLDRAADSKRRNVIDEITSQGERTKLNNLHHYAEGPVRGSKIIDFVDPTSPDSSIDDASNDAAGTGDFLDFQVEKTVSDNRATNRDLPGCHAEPDDVEFSTGSATPTSTGDRLTCQSNNMTAQAEAQPCCHGRLLAVDDIKPQNTRMSMREDTRHIIIKSDGGRHMQHCPVKKHRVRLRLVDGSEPI